MQDQKRLVYGIEYEAKQPSTEPEREQYSWFPTYKNPSEKHPNRKREHNDYRTEKG